MTIEAKVRKYLNDALEVPVYIQRPETPPESYVIIERAGGIERNYVSQITLAVKSLAQTMGKAIDLDYSVRLAMRGLISVDAVSGVHLNATTNFTDTSTKEYRYQSTFLINYMEDK